MSLVTAENLVKDYRTGDVAVHAIRGVDFTIEPASFVCFVGPSGSGKSTLLNMIGCLDPPSNGRLTVSGTDVSTLDHHAAAVFRGENIGFVFQDFNLIPVLTAYENVEYPLIMVQKWTPQRRRDRIQSLLTAAGIADQADKRPDQLSGGQKQRVAVARALVTNPTLVLADEPTANLDSHSAENLMALFSELNDHHGVTFLISTHDTRVMRYAKRLIRMRDGRIIEDISQTPQV